MSKVLPPVSPLGVSAAASLGEAMLVLDSRRRVQSVSASALTLLGRSADELLGRVWEEAVGLDASGLSIREHPLQRKGRKPFSYVITLTFAEAGADAFEKELGPWAASTELALIRTAEGRVLAVNDAFARKFGVPRRSWSGQDAANLIHPEDLASWRLALARIGLSPYRGSHEHRWQTAQGWRWLAWEDHAVRDADGLIVAYRSIGRDVTKRRLAEEHFYKLASAVEQSPFAIVMTTPDGRVQYVNPSYTQSTGYTLEDVFEKQVPVLRQGHSTEDSYRAMMDCVAAGQRWSGELVSRHRDGRALWEFVQVAPIRNPLDEVTHLLCVREDITERKNLEDQLRQAQKMESLGTLAGGIAHDFNNILAIINGFAEIGLSRTPPEDPNVRCLREVHNAAQRAIGLVRQILTFSRKAESSFRAVSINQQLRDLGRMCAETFPRTISFRYELDDSLPEFLADPNQVQQVVMNLCVNARDAMGAGGVITVGTTRVAGESLRRLGADAETSYVCIRVSDTGCGMPAAVRARIFEPFFTTKQNAGGTGLGLAVVYGIILSHHGFIEVDSAEGQGTTFSVYLPLQAVQPEKGTSRPPVQAGMPVFAPGSETVLIVEDEASLRDLLGTVMQPAGYRVLFARDGQEALETIDRLGTQIDGLLLDLNLPHVAGVDVLRHCRKVAPAAAVVVVSGNLTTETKRELSELGKPDFIPKPYTLEDLGRRLRRALDQRPSQPEPNGSGNPLKT